MPDPVRPFFEVTRRFSTRQTTAVVLVAEWAFSLALIGIGTFAGASGQVALDIGAVAAILGLAGFGYVVFWRREMLRSDRQEFAESVFNFALREDVDDRAVMVAQALLVAPKAPKDTTGESE